MFLEKEIVLRELLISNQPRDRRPRTEDREIRTEGFVTHHRRMLQYILI